MSTASRSAKASSPVAVGKTVVYAGLGVGHVVKHEKKRVDGTSRDSVVVELVTGLRVTLSVEQATERLRPVADKRDLEAVRKILGSAPSERTGQWTQRHRETKAKLATGGVTDLAEIVRDGEPFQNSARLSPAERGVYLQARALLVRELCVARDLTEDEAEAWIDAQVPVAETNGD